MFCWYLSRSHMQPSKTSKTFVLQCISMFLPFTEKCCLMLFLIFFRYQFVHWCSMSFCIDFDSLLGPFGIKFFICWWSFFWWNFESICYRFCTKLAPKRSEWYRLFSVIFRILFPHTCTFYLRQTYKCQKPRFPTFFKQLKECIHACTFYHSKTYKCAVTVFIILKKKII